jgi:hypothetical protein
MVIQHELLSFNTSNCYFSVVADEKSLARYLKGAYRENKPRFREKFIKHFRTAFRAYEIEDFGYLLDNIDQAWDHVVPFSYKEAFEIDNNTFKSLVFSSIDIREMIYNLGATRIAVEGKELVNKTWNPIAKEFEMTPYTVVYELYHVNGKQLGIEDESRLPIVKCWCTTTNDEHWLWVDSTTQSPLEAIASTCVIYKSMHGKINHIIRQGDVFLFEMSEDVTPSDSEDTMTLPMNEYFSLLKSQA